MRSCSCIAFPDDGAAKRFAHMFEGLGYHTVICGKVCSVAQPSGGGGGARGDERVPWLLCADFALFAVAGKITREETADENDRSAPYCHLSGLRWCIFREIFAECWVMVFPTLWQFENSCVISSEKIG